MNIQKLQAASTRFWMTELEELRGELGQASRDLGREADTSLEPFDEHLKFVSEALHELEASHVDAPAVVLDIHSAIVSFEALYTAATSGPPLASSGGGGAQANRMMSSVRNVLSKALSKLTALKSWLLTILQSATTFKEWSVSGDISTGFLGLGSAKLEIKFGP